jgi:hypothetical protein
MRAGPTPIGLWPNNNVGNSTQLNGDNMGGNMGVAVPLHVPRQLLDLSGRAQPVIMLLCDKQFEGQGCTPKKSYSRLRNVHHKKREVCSLSRLIAINGGHYRVLLI